MVPTSLAIGAWRLALGAWRLALKGDALHDGHHLEPPAGCEGKGLGGAAVIGIASSSCAPAARVSAASSTVAPGTSGTSKRPPKGRRPTVSAWSAGRSTARPTGSPGASCAGLDSRGISMAQGKTPKALSADELAEADDLRQTIKDIEGQIAQARSGSSSQEFRADLDILLREAKTRLDTITPPSTKPPPP